MECESDRADDRSQQTHRSDAQASGYQPDVLEGGAEEGDHKPCDQSPEAERKAEHTRRNAREHASIQPSASGAVTFLGWNPFVLDKGASQCK